MDRVVTVVAKDDGIVDITPKPGAEGFARWIADALEKDVQAAKAAKAARAPTTVGDMVKANEAGAHELDSQAVRWEDLISRNQCIDADLKRFYAEKARACRAQAARLRGEPS